MITCGIDAGSRAIKIVLFDAQRQAVLAAGAADQGVQQDRLARQLYERLLAEAGIAHEQVTARAATGYGRNIISFAERTITEITCHAVGVHHVWPEARTLVDIGGQDSKVVRLGADGAVEDFAMNDRCAAGTGRFLEVMAQRLELRLDELGDIAARSTQPAVISSMCVVFAETEIIGLLAAGADPADIVAGVQASIVRRVAAMAGRQVCPPVAFTGGGALVSGMDRALAAALEQPVRVVPAPRMTGALGAAILAAR
ncbi:MAG TPA: acyl-CoA dehydratase activase [Phycisphaerae bacterium]|nr:acyl-CoA dehydratase activase [Phycisphaerae bacterium]HOJ73650.1 acyl-CoA dehydratase activase [Phycisphaerae bacterium]HOM50297.1 acyl-CoA dehydratase activase [Phycisphaerae bacterium]HOQ84861.1 acyl-CoA dehydratase activase [Phycisphaerae bacterium]HPP27602.1 acyl-CoA dehydratase activase [Phycisphaerae bacterium]